MNILVMGPQGSGKSTQAELLAKRLNLPHIETGNVYRELAKEDSELGRKIKGVLEKGGLVDDETTFEVVDKNLAKIKGGFVLDGFPRTLTQAQRELFPIDKVIYINLSDEEAIERLLLRGRADDKIETIKARLKLFHERTEPILDYYRKQEKLLEIDGSKSVEEVSGQIKLDSHR